MIEFNVEGMSCSHCAAAVTREIKAIDAAAEVAVDLVSGKVTVTTGSSRDQVRGAIEQAGYTVKS